MANWADYVVSEVRLNVAGTHIDSVKVADLNGTSLGPWRTELRVTVIANLRAQKTYFTVTPSRTSVGTYDKGAKVERVVVGGAEYIRTDANSVARDNLDNLTRF